MQIRMPHSLEPEEVGRRVRAAAERHDVAAGADESDCAGELLKKTPLGAVRASWRADATEVVVDVRERPAFLPEGTVRRLLEEALSSALAPPA